MEVLDPTYGDDRPAFEPAARPTSLDGLTVGIVSNGKQGTVRFFDELERILREDLDVADVARVTKPNYSAPAPGEIVDKTRTWHALVAGGGD